MVVPPGFLPSWRRAKFLWQTAPAKAKCLLSVGFYFANPLMKAELSTLLCKIKKPLLRRGSFLLSNVVPPGIEPGTQGFSVLCSTD
jgi:hypothetical protein